MTATTIHFTMCAVRLPSGRYLARRGNRAVLVGDYGMATHYQIHEATGGELDARILRRDARRQGIEGADDAEIVAVDNDDVRTLRVLDA